MIHFKIFFYDKMLNRFLSTHLLTCFRDPFFVHERGSN
ncbi:hypothetical protein CAEBREN_11653 [Caenorhabditis brenneri]|uniref:Uncharacterized protein n=1 Tax=Caenorhabditis brenneri TaxID=135651 RepID=G0NL15_CAEBE|nr:hypothetical protein CAEBREN_11653 [Caenorhabditis brenneri]